MSHFRERIEPNGYKGMIVAYDRECCLMYKRELDQLVPPGVSTVVIDTHDDKAGLYREYYRNRDEEKKVLDTFRERSSSLKLLIVTSKLLTGFDAPILQAMYLDKPMRDHGLIQAVCRTNRTYDDGKTHGLVVDYVGVFDNAAESLRFDEGAMKDVVRNIEEVKSKIPGLVKKCLDYFPGADRNIPGWRGLKLAQEFLPTDNMRDSFGADYRVLNRAWDYVSPDRILLPYRDDYCWLSRVYDSLRPSDGSGALVWAELGAKTLALIHSNIDVGEIQTDGEIMTLDGNLAGDSATSAHKIETDLTARINAHKGDSMYQQLGEKVERLKQQLELGLITSAEFLRGMSEILREAERLDSLTEVFGNLGVSEHIIRDIDDRVNTARFDNWQNTVTGQNNVKAALRTVMWVKYGIKDDDIFDRVYKYVEQHY